MPSPHSSYATQDDARTIARNLGCEAIEIEIAPLMDAYEEVLAERFAGTEPGVAEENLQSRIRGNLVMALSNKFGWLPLSTGNKSEMSVGYATLYGDMAGGFAVIKDVPKTLVYELVENRNRRAGRELVPASAIERPPSAELRPDQFDTDSLPPYELLDPALEEYVERDGGREQIAAGIDAEVADHVIGPRRPGRVQAPAGAARGEDHDEGVRPRPADADHQPLRRLSGDAQEAPRSQRADGDVSRERAQSRPSSSLISTSQTQVVRPRCLARATASIVPSRTGRRNVVSFAWPMATTPGRRPRRWRARRPTRRAPRRRRRGRSRTAA